MRFAYVVLALSLAGCLPGVEAPPERPECADEALGAVLALCRAEVAAAPTATAKANARKECIARVDAWEKCQ